MTKQRLAVAAAALGAVVLMGVELVGSGTVEVVGQTCAKVTCDSFGDSGYLPISWDGGANNSLVVGARYRVLATDRVQLGLSTATALSSGPTIPADAPEMFQMSALNGVGIQPHGNDAGGLGGIYCYAASGNPTVQFCPVSAGIGR